MNWDKNLIREELSKIAVDGRLTPESVIEASKPKKHPLHGYFEWDDKTAAHEHRLYQARKLIAFVPVVREVQSRSVSPQWVRDPTVGHEQGYVSIDIAKKEPATAAQIMDYEISRALSHLERARNIAVELGRAEVIDKTIESLQEIRKAS